ncbi:MAG: Bug family tripartite tricarboxylate transporter substrate binding protein [Burkholderiales bacterium]
MTRTIRLIASIFGLTICIFSAQFAIAQTWPDKPIRIIMPYTPGSVPEALFRAVSAGLEARLGQRFIVDARPGGDGAIGGGAVTRAAPDGYTLLLAGTGLYVVTPHINKNLGFDPAVALDAMSMFADAPLLAVVSPAVPSRNLAELVEYIRANPGKFNFGAPNAGSVTHLTGVALSQLAGNAMVFVPYKGVAPMVQALMVNDLQVAFPALTGAVSQIRAGKVKVLAVMARQRMAELPDVPTTVEAGFPQLVGTNWWALSAPRGTARAIIDRMAQDLRVILLEPETKKRFSDLGHSPMPMTPADTTAFLKTESARYKELVERGSIKAE